MKGLGTSAKAFQNITVRIITTNTHGYISTTSLYSLLCKEFGLPYNEMEVNPEAEKMDKTDFISQPSEKIPTEIPLDTAATDIPNEQNKTTFDGQNSVIDIDTASIPTPLESHPKFKVGDDVTCDRFPQGEEIYIAKIIGNMATCMGRNYPPQPIPLNELALAA